MGVLDEITPVRSTYSTTKGGSRLDQILADLDALPKTKDFPQADLDRLVAMLEAPVEVWGHRQMFRTVQQVCAALGVDTHDLNYQNVTQWRAKRWTEL